MLKIFLLSADPKENSKLNVDVEFNQIEQEILPKSEYREDFSIKLIPAANYDNLLDVLMSNETSIIHFSGHGVGEEGLVLVDQKGKKDILPTQKLTELVKVLQEENQYIKCVFFNGCYTEIQAQAISPYVEYVIGMSDQVFDDDAVKFAKYFYKGLFKKKSIETSFKLGCIFIGYDSMSIVDYDQNTKRAIYDPAPEDEKVSQPNLNYNIPQLIVNKKLSIAHNEFPKPEQILTDKQWKDLEGILEEIDNFDLLKNIFSKTLEKQEYKYLDFQNAILSIEKLVNFKILLLDKYAKHKNKDDNNKLITVLEFAKQILQRNEEEILEEQKTKVKDWLVETAKEKNIQELSIFPETSGEIVVSLPTLNSYLLISIIESTLFSEKFSLDAELIPDYQEGNQDYEIIPITSEPIGINEISSEQIEPHIAKIIDKAIEKIPLDYDYNLTIELFVPFEYLGETFELYKVPIQGRKKRTLKPLGAQYPLIMHCLDRYKNPKIKRVFKQKWKQIKKFIEDEKEIKIEETISDYLQLLNPNVNWDKLETKWRRNPFFSINIIDQLTLDVPLVEEQPEYKYLDIFQASGVPLLLWTRRSDVLCDCECNKLTIKEKFKEILQIQSWKHLGEIFKNVHHLREDAHDEGDKAKKYLGYHLGFICDHPDLIPSHLVGDLDKVQGMN